MTPRNTTPIQSTERKAQDKTGKARMDTIRHIKVLLTAGAVAGTMLGWALMSHQESSNASPATPQTDTTELIGSASPTSSPQAVATEQALQLPSSATSTPESTATSPAQATNTATLASNATITDIPASTSTVVAIDTATPLAPATATATARPTTPRVAAAATTVRATTLPIIKKAPTAVAKTRSSR